MDTFNIPFYTPSPMEVQAEVQKEGSFSINLVEVSEVTWSGNKRTENGHLSSNGDHRNEGYRVAKCMRAVAEPMLLSHFGQGVIEEVFHRFRLLIEDCIAKEKNEFINVTVSLTRRPA